MQETFLLLLLLLFLFFLSLPNILEGWSYVGPRLEGSTISLNQRWAKVGKFDYFVEPICWPNVVPILKGWHATLGQYLIKLECWLLCLANVGVAFTTYIMLGQSYADEQKDVGPTLKEGIGPIFRRSLTNVGPTLCVLSGMLISSRQK